MDAVVYSYTLLCLTAVIVVLPFQLALMQGPPINECGPFAGLESFSQLFHLVGQLLFFILVYSHYLGISFYFTPAVFVNN